MIITFQVTGSGAPEGQHTALALPAGSHQEVRREPANTFPVIVSPRGWRSGGGQQAPLENLGRDIKGPGDFLAQGGERPRSSSVLGGSVWKMVAEQSPRRVDPPARCRVGPSPNENITAPLEGLPDTLPGPLSGTRGRRGAARGRPAWLAGRAQRQRSALGGAPISQDLAR